MALLMADMFYGTGAEIPMSRFIQPRLECELGFVMGRRLKGPNCTIFDVLNAVDYVVPAAEIVDGRTHRIDPVTNQPRCVLDSIADNAEKCRADRRRQADPADGNGSALGWRIMPPKQCHRGIRRCGGGAKSSGERCGVARDQAALPFDIALEPVSVRYWEARLTATVEAHAGDTLFLVRIMVRLAPSRRDLFDG